MGQTVADRWIGVDDDVLASFFFPCFVLLFLLLLLIAWQGVVTLGALSNVGKLI